MLFILLVIDKYTHDIYVSQILDSLTTPFLGLVLEKSKLWIHRSENCSR